MEGRRTTEPAYTISSPGALGSGELKKSPAGRENVLVLTDVFTKFTMAFPSKDQKTVIVAKGLLREWFPNYRHTKKTAQ